MLDIRGIDGPNTIGIVNLSVALMFFERSYNRVADLMPGFIALCESQSKTGESENTGTADRD